MGWREALHKIDRAAWLRFFGGALGLAVAFATALLSTAAREAGDALVSVALAFASLLLALLVAIFVIPPLLKRITRGRLREALSYEMTREGLVYCVLILTISLAAMNTGNNLLFLMVSAMLAAVIVSGVISAAMLLALELRFEPPEHIFAGERREALVVIRNRRKWLPAFSITVEPPRKKQARATWRWRWTTFAYPPPKSGKQPWIRLKDLSVERIAPPVEPEAILDRSLYAPMIPAGGATHAALELSFLRRGRLQQKQIALATRFPFSFLRKIRLIPFVCERVVYPSVELNPEMEASARRIAGECESQVRGRGVDLYGLRDYQPEDPAHFLDWKATARSGDLKIREFTREEEKRLRILFDNPGTEALSAEAYEQALQLAASVAWRLHQSEASLSYAAPGLTPEADIWEFLEYLALAEPGGDAAWLNEVGDTDAFNLLFTARPRGAIAAELWRSSYIWRLDETVAQKQEAAH